MSKHQNPTSEPDPWEALESELFGIPYGKEHSPNPIEAAEEDVRPAEDEPSLERRLGIPSGAEPDDDDEEEDDVPAPEASADAADEPDEDEVAAPSAGKAGAEPAPDDFWNALAGWDWSQPSSSESESASSERSSGGGPRGRGRERSGRDSGGRSGDRGRQSRERQEAESPRSESPAREPAERAESPASERRGSSRGESSRSRDRDAAAEPRGEGRSRRRERDEAPREERSSTDRPAGRSRRPAEPSPRAAAPREEEDPWGDDVFAEESTPASVEDRDTAASPEAVSSSRADREGSDLDEGDGRRRRRRRGRGGRRGRDEEFESTSAESTGPEDELAEPADLDDVVAETADDGAEEEEARAPRGRGRGRRTRGSRRPAETPRDEFDDEESLEPSSYDTRARAEDDDDDDDDSIEPGSWGAIPTWEEAIEYLLHPEMVQVDPNNPGGQSARGQTEGQRSATRHYGGRRS